MAAYCYFDFSLRIGRTEAKQKEKRRTRLEARVGKKKKDGNKEG